MQELLLSDFFQTFLYNALNPPVWGGSQPSVHPHREPACPFTVVSSKGALAMLQSVSLFHGFLPTALPWEKLFFQFFFQGARTAKRISCGRSPSSRS